MSSAEAPAAAAPASPSSRSLATGGSFHATIDDINNNIANEEEEVRVGIIDRKAHSCFQTTTSIELQYPRTYNVLIRIILPLLSLIGLSFFCGYFLVLLESPSEIQANDQSLASYADFAVRVSASDSKPTTNSTVLEHCVATIKSVTQDADVGGIATQLRECAVRFADAQVTPSLSFHWISCSDGDGKAHKTKEEQIQIVLGAWMESYEEAVLDNMQQSPGDTNMTFIDAHTQALTTASGHDNCQINAAAGALFWFTIMTTIGYGNVAPVSTGGRGLIYSLGFISILSFTAIISKAGVICLVIMDDFFHRIRAPFLTKGAGAALFWLAAWWTWILCIAGIVLEYVENRNGKQQLTLQETFWFSYISGTTVGLGDIHIPHETFRAADMFYTPLLFLISFLLLSNFLHKFSEFVGSLFSKDNTLETILESSRRKNKDAKVASENAD